MAEKEYIERDRIVKFIETGLNDPDKVKAFGHDAVEILAEIHLAPAADVVEVVRCEHCKFCSTVVDFIGNRQSFCGEYPTPRMVKPKDFCSRGERKEAES